MSSNEVKSLLTTLTLYLFYSVEGFYIKDAFNKVILVIVICCDIPNNRLLRRIVGFFLSERQRFCGSALSQNRTLDTEKRGVMHCL